MTHAIIYDRASTINQGDNFSRVNAKEYGIKIAEQNGFTWEYVKEIGSGTTLTGRPKMMKVLDRIVAGEVQAIIVQDLDRLARPEEAVVYSTIRQTIMQYEVIIYTHTSRIDLNNDDDDFVADISMSVAKKERRRMRKRMRRGMKARIESGKFGGGTAALGYTVVGSGSDSDLEIEPEEATLVELIFDTLDKKGGNLRGTAKNLNVMGYRGKTGKLFSSNTIKWIATRKLYAGIFESSVTDKVMHRPDLQIISVDQFKRVQEFIKSRSNKGKPTGARGSYIFTGFVTCGTCGGTMVASNRGPKKVIYECVNYRMYGKEACHSAKAYSEHLILPPIAEFLADLIQQQIDFYTHLDDAASQYGKSVTEEALEAAIKGELASVQAGKERLIEAISLGILTNEEAAVKLADLREHEQRLTVEIASVAEKAAILQEWQNAVDALKGQGTHRIQERLYYLAEEKPIAFRRLLSLVFEPNSLQVKTERAEGRQWRGIFEGYELTDTMREQTNTSSFVTEA